MIVLIQKKHLYTIILSLIGIVLIIFGLCHFKKSAPTYNENLGPCVAIIIDDFGGSGEGVEEMTKLGIPITAAVMPFLDNSKAHAEKAYKAGLEIILHTPMEPEHGKASWLGPKGITTDLSNDEIKKRVRDGLDEICYAVGMNNHMGSKAMQDERVLRSVLEVAKEKNLYFVDSKTTAKSKAEPLCKELGLCFYGRDIFLDNVKDVGSIEKQLEKAGNIALKKGYAIAIGHVGAEGGKITAKAIANMAPTLKQKGIKFVFVSQIK